MGSLSAGLDVEAFGARPRVDRQSETLVGTHCNACGAVSWPSRALCHRCGKPELSQTKFLPTGKLLTYTRVWIPRPGLECPYVLAQVMVDEGPVIFGHLRGPLPDEPLPVGVHIVLDSDLAGIPPFWFELDRSQ